MSSSNSALLVAIAVYLIFGFFATYIIRDQTLKSAAESTSTELTSIVSRSASSNLYFDPTLDPDAAFANSERLSAFTDDIKGTNIQGVKIYAKNHALLNSEGDALKSSDENLKENLDAALQGNVLIRQVSDSPLIIAYIPVKRGGLTTHGVAVIHYDWSKVLSSIKDISNWVWLGTLASALIVTLALWLAFRAFNRELRKRHRALSTILDNAPIGIYTIARDGTIDSFNPKMVELSGAVSSDEIIGRNAFQMESYESTGLASHFRRSLDEGQPFETEVEYRSDAAKKRTWRHYRGIPIFRPYTSQVDRLLLLVEDVTRQKELEAKNQEYAEQLEKWAWDRTQRLVQARERLSNVIGHIPVIVWATDEKLDLTVCQGSALKGIGLKQGELVGKSAKDVYADHPEIIGGLRKALAGESTSFQSIINGRHLQSYVSPAPGKDGRIGAINGITIDITDRVKAEQKFTAMAANSPDITTLLDVDGKITYATGPTEAMFGYSHSALIGLNILDLIHPEDREKIAAKIGESAKNSGKPFKDTMRIRRDDGGWVHVEAIAQSHLDNPMIGAIVVNSRDITDRIAAENELRRRIATETAMAEISAQFATSSELSNSVDFALAEIGRIAHADAVFFLNEPHGKTFGKFSEWLAPGRNSVAQTVIDAIRDHDSWHDVVFNKESLCIRELNAIAPGDGPNGFSGSLMIRPITSHEQIVGGLGMIVGSEQGQDYLEACDSRILLVAAEVMSSAIQRNQAFETARLQTKQQATVAAFGQTVITEIDQKRLLEIAANTVKSVLKADIVGFYRYRPESEDFRIVAGIGWPDGVLNEAVIPSGVNSQAGFTMLAKQSTVVNDYSDDKRFNRSAPVAASNAKSGVSVIVGDSHNAWGVFGVHFLELRTLSNYEVGFVEAIAHLTGLGLNKIESQARVHELDSLKTKFIQVVSHQFRTPLSAARWNLESMLAGDVGSLTPEMRQFLRITYEATTEVIRRIRDLLTVLDIEERRITLNPEPISIESVITSVVGEFHKRADLKNIKVNCAMPSTRMPALNLDQERIRTAIEKILENSVIYTPAEGTIDIKLTHDERNVTVEISDTGIGIPAAEQTRIFERFYRASNAATAKPDASGLGLTIARHFIEQHDGFLTLESGEGRGTTVRMSLPLRTAGA